MSGRYYQQGEYFQLIAQAVWMTSVGVMQEIYYSGPPPENAETNK